MAASMVEEPEANRKSVHHLSARHDAPHDVELGVRFERSQKRAQTGAESLGPEVGKSRLPSRGVEERRFVETRKLAGNGKGQPSYAVENANGQRAMRGRRGDEVHVPYLIVNTSGLRGEQDRLFGVATNKSTVLIWIPDGC